MYNLTVFKCKLAIFFQNEIIIAYGQNILNYPLWLSSIATSNLTILAQEVYFLISFVALKPVKEAKIGLQMTMWQMTTFTRHICGGW